MFTLSVVKQGGDIAHQSLPVEGTDADGHRVGANIFTPGNFDQSLAILYSQYVGTILTVDGCSVSPGDVTDDLVAGCGVAAFRHGGQQAFQSKDGDGFAGNCFAGCRNNDQDIVAFFGFQKFIDHPSDGQVTAPNGIVEFFRSALP